MTRTVLGLASFTLLAFWGTSSNSSNSGDTKKEGDLAAVKAVSKKIIAADNSSDIGPSRTSMRMKPFGYHRGTPSWEARRRSMRAIGRDTAWHFRVKYESGMVSMPMRKKTLFSFDGE